MPRGTRHRLNGLLLTSPRGLVLRVDDGGLWALDAPRKADRLIGRRVVVGGTRSGFDLLDVDWIEAQQNG